MKTLLAIVLLASSTIATAAENLPISASSQANAGNTGVRTTVTTTSGATGATTTVTTPEPAPTPTTAPTVRSFKADLAYCRSLAAEERRGCERETYAARAEGLYR